jgi:HlyD family secretion protein
LQVDIRANDVETAKASIARAEAQLRNTTIVLNQTTIRAPSDGVVLQKYVEQGTIIASATGFSSGGGQSIVQIGDLSRVYVDAQVDETDISQVRVGQTVKIEFDAVPDQPFEGVVQRIEPRGVTDNNITTVKARIELKSPTPALRPGLNGECEFLIAEKKNVLVIPSRAVRNDKGKKFVQILVGDEKNPKVETREVKIGMETMEAVEVLSGVKEGEKIVTAIITPSKDGKDDKGGRGGGQGRESSAPGGLVGRR